MLSQEMLSSALQSAPDAIVIVDASGRILFANRQLLALLGYEYDEVRGQAIEMLLPERFRPRHLGHRSEYAENARVRPMGVDLDLFALAKDGREVPVEISLSPIEDAGRLLVAAALRDVTERKKIQTELRDAREAAERANQAKSRFLATASHDLRQPLQALALLNGTLRRVVQEPDAREALAHQAQAIEAMSKLLNALLDISKLESGAVRPDPTDFAMAALFEEMRNEFASLAEAKGLELRISAPSGLVHSDRSLVGQILRNLVSNAIKYTRHGFVELRALMHSSAMHIEVIDSGVGIAPDQLPYIYDEFYQVGVATNAFREGYGLGLSIVARLVRLLGLHLAVRSELGRGSTFDLELPLGSGTTITPAASPVAAQAVDRQAAAPQVLLVDDDPGVRSATTMLLKVEGYRVVSASSLQEAVERLAEMPGVDLLVTDYHLQNGSTGLDVINAVRTTAGEGLKAVLVTGDTSSTIRGLPSDERIRLASKPIDADELLGLIKALLAS
ncbi:MAG TPA: hybrid sensor histidine kinase/response regulator [Steroidobacteraceae bacterium]|nr:hybrid sensor histidine kinase/response regulator [Steroidobacteraceae bacterium]